jgi:hypothetical protein
MQRWIQREGGGPKGKDREGAVNLIQEREGGVVDLVGGEKGGKKG